MPPRAPQVLRSGQPQQPQQQRPWFNFNFAERQRITGYGRKEGLSEAETQAAYESGQPIGTTRYQRDVVRGLRSGQRRIERPGLFTKSPQAQQRAIRTAQKYDPNVTPQEVDAWIREGSFKYASRDVRARAPARIIGPDPAYVSGVVEDDRGIALYNSLDTPEIAAFRLEVLENARRFIQAERDAGNLSANKERTEKRIMAMRPDQLSMYANQDITERKDFARNTSDEGIEIDGKTEVNMFHYH